MSIGFIVLRHVNSTITNLYWQTAYDSIRKYYPTNHIIFIDDNSDYSLITEKVMTNTTIIQSEFPGRAEVLPYYYYLKNKLFDTAVMLHDCIFVNRYIDFTVDKYKFIWEFEHHSDQEEDEIRIIKSLSNNEELLELHSDKNRWKGCAGALTVINYDYLKYIDSKYNIANLLVPVRTRFNRMSFERVFACMLQVNDKRTTLLGNINEYMPFGYTYYEFMRDNNLQIKSLPFIKVWTGR